jgi:Tfp pilus assembly protein PilX
MRRMAAALFRMLRREEGTAFLIAMLVLMLLTLMGTFALMTTDIEIRIAGNEKEYVRDFYVADSGWKEAAPWLNDRATPPKPVNTSLDDNVVKNFGGGGDGITNEDFPAGTQDGTLAGIPYWNRIEYLSNSVAPGSGKEYLRFNYLVTSNAGGGQEIEVTLYKIYKVGY